MTEERKNTKLVFLLLCILIATSIGYGYEKILVNKNFTVFTEDETSSSYLPFTIGY